MTEELGPQARALLDAAREGLSPDAAAIRRVRARVGVATGGAAAGTVVGAKLILVIGGVVAAIAVGTAWYAGRGADAVAPGALASPARVSAREQPVEPAVPAIADADLITIEPPDPVPDLDGRPRAGTRQGGRPRSEAAPSPGRARPATAPVAPPGPRGAGRAIGLADEVEILDVAMVALRRGDARAALAAVARYAGETAGRGQLAEDAAAIEVEALCQLGDPARVSRLAAFDARFPHSAQRARLDDKCR